MKKVIISVISVTVIAVVSSLVVFRIHSKDAV